MPGRLASHVHVRDAQGARHVFGPDDEVPDWAAERISNPKAWAQRPEAQDGAARSVTDTGQTSGAGAATRPAETASKDVWLAYAAVVGVEVPEGATKPQIIAAVTAADQP